MKELTKYVNTQDSGESHCHDFNIGLKHRKTRSKHIQGVHNVFHKNRFAVLTAENVHSDVDSDCKDSMFVELNGGNACSTGKGVNVNTVSQNAHKGKNAPYLPDKIVLSRTKCSPIQKQDKENHEYDQTSESLRVEMPNIVKCDKCSSRDPTGDTSNATL